MKAKRKKPTSGELKRYMARHALGLPNDSGRSYRNRYYLAPKSRGHGLWLEMVIEGRAGRVMAADGKTLDLFYLTPKGARWAINPGERLDPEDFPDARS